MPISDNHRHILLWVLTEDQTPRLVSKESRFASLRPVRGRSTSVIVKRESYTEEQRLRGSLIQRESSDSSRTSTSDTHLTRDQRITYFLLSYTNIWTEAKLWTTLKSIIQRPKATPTPKGILYLPTDRYIFSESSPISLFTSMVFVRKWLSLYKLSTKVLIRMLSFYQGISDVEFLNELKLAILKSHRATQKLSANSSVPLATVVVDPKKMNLECPLNLRQRWSPKETAKELCLMEQETMLAIPPFELATLAWTHDSDEPGKPRSKRIRESIEIFNRISDLIIMDILYTSEPIETVQYYIEVAQYLYEYKNYNTLTSVVSSFSRWQVDRVKILWTQLSPYHLERLAFLSNFVSAGRNYMPYRETLVRDPIGIPIMSVILRDLIHICEGNPTHHIDGSLNVDRLLLLGKGISITRGCSSLYSHWKTNVKLRNYLLSVFEINDDILMEKSRELVKSLKSTVITLVASGDSKEPVMLFPYPH